MVRVRRPKNSVFRDILELQYAENVKYKLYKSVKGSKDWVQRLGLSANLPVHNGCVNCICWNEKGDKLLSGSDDQHLVISNPYNYKVLTNHRSSHKANIFSAKFLPGRNDTGIVSCSGDGMILYSDLLRPDETRDNVFNCHIGTTYEVATIPYDPFTFLSCGEDYTVRCFDLRTKEKCIKSRCVDICNEDVIISCQRAVTALTVNTVSPHLLGIGCSDSTVRIYDRRMLNRSRGDTAKPFMTFIAPGMERRSYRITSLCFSPRGEDILVSYSSENLYSFGLQGGETTTFETERTERESMPVESSESPMAPVRRLRLRGDWSDTGPDARPQHYFSPDCGGGQARPTLHGILMQRMTDALSRMLNDPAIRAALSHGCGGGQARPTLHGTLMQRMTDVLSRMLNDPATRAALSHGGESFPETDQAAQNERLVHDRHNIFSSPPRGEELEVELSTEETVEIVNPIDLPLPSFSSSFIQAQPELPLETMEIDEHVVACQENKETCIKKEEKPSTSSAPSDDVASTSSAADPNNSHLNELSTMYHGFVEKHGVEPMVNLMYSDVGSTASCISVFVGRDVPREATLAEKSPSQLVPPCEETPSARSSGQGSSSKEENSFSPIPLDVPRINAVKGNVSSSDSEDELGPVTEADCRLVHPIEKHMDDAIENARKDGCDEEMENTKTRKSHFKQKFVGHRNARTMIKEATFWGDDHVISGSDCGHVFMWDRHTGELDMLLEADHHVVNCVQPHPYYPILATSGIDYDVKLWAPIQDEVGFDVEMAVELVRRNAVMLEETKDTITVPASFMIRMLACLNQIRRGGRGRPMRRESNTNSD